MQSESVAATAADPPAAAPRKNFVTAEQIFAEILPPRYEEVEIRGVGWIRVAAMSSEARDQFEDVIYVEQMEPDPDTGEMVPRRRFNRRGFRAKLLAATVICEDGSLLFTEDEVLSLLRSRVEPMEPAVEVAMRLNGYSKRDEDELVGK